MKEAASEARNTAAVATSSADPLRWRPELPVTAFVKPSLLGSLIPLPMLLSMAPGHSALHRIPASEYMKATFFVRPTTANLEVVYARPPRPAQRPLKEAVLMIVPSRFSLRKYWTAFLHAYMTLFKLIFIIRSHTSSGISAMGRRLSKIPALLMTTSTFPKASTV